MALSGALVCAQNVTANDSSDNTIEDSVVIENQNEQKEENVLEDNSKELKESDVESKEVVKPVVMASTLTPTTHNELTTMLANATDGITINLSNLENTFGALGNHAFSVNNDVTFVADGKTIKGVEFTVAANKTVTLSNITMEGYIGTVQTSAGTIQGDGNLVVKSDATIIGSDSRTTSAFYSGAAVFGLKNVEINGKVSPGYSAQYAAGAAVNNCYSLKVDGGTIQGATLDATRKSGGCFDLIYNVNHVELSNATLIGNTDPSSGGGGFIRAVNITINNSKFKYGNTKYRNTAIQVGYNKCNKYAKDEKVLLKINNTNLIMANSNADLSSGMSLNQYENAQCTNVNSVIEIASATDEIGQVDIGSNVTIQGASTKVGSAAHGIYSYGKSRINLASGSKVIGGSTSDATGFGGYGIVGAEVVMHNATVIGGDGCYGGYAIARCYSDSVLSDKSIITGGNGLAIGGHAIYKSAKVCIEDADVTGGNGAKLNADESNRAGSAINWVDTVVLKNGTLKPGDTGYTTVDAMNLYMQGGTITNSAGQIKAQKDCNASAIYLYGDAGKSNVQISGGSIGCVFDSKNNEVLSIVTDNGYNLYRKVDPNVQWKEPLEQENLVNNFYLDEVEVDGIKKPENKISTDKEILNYFNNDISYVASEGMVTVTLSRDITEQDEMTFFISKDNGKTVSYEKTELEYTLVTGTKNVITFKQPKGNLKIELNKKVIEYTVNFDTNGGNKLDSITVKDGEKINKPSNPSKENYVFEGWYSNSELTTLWDFANDVVSDNLTLYAKYTKIDSTPTDNNDKGSDPKQPNENQNDSSNQQNSNNQKANKDQQSKQVLTGDFNNIEFYVFIGIMSSIGIIVYIKYRKKHTVQK